MFFIVESISSTIIETLSTTTKVVFLLLEGEILVIVFSPNVFPPSSILLQFLLLRRFLIKFFEVIRICVNRYKRCDCTVLRSKLCSLLSEIMDHFPPDQYAQLQFSAGRSLASLPTRIARPSLSS